MLYLGYNYYNPKVGYLCGSFSWDAEKGDYPYNSEEGIEKEIELQYANLVEDEIPIFSIEKHNEIEDRFEAICYYMPTKDMCVKYNVDYTQVLDAIKRMGKEIKLIKN